MKWLALPIISNCWLPYCKPCFQRAVAWPEARFSCLNLFLAHWLDYLNCASFCLPSSSVELTETNTHFFPFGVTGANKPSFMCRNVEAKSNFLPEFWTQRGLLGIPQFQGSRRGCFLPRATGAGLGCLKRWLGTPPTDTLLWPECLSPHHHIHISKS